MPTAPPAAAAAPLQEDGRQHEQAGGRVGIAGLARLDRGGVGHADLGVRGGH
ncbi:hypothetical protein ACFVT5_40640 [Streptomyces sp. NPDC058001]|uniref:hypothetical protein n=1 Tax=Streptomyces sp. NPDC058001 TaxID=3346300 RepID=UPI0036E11CB6